MTGRFVSKHDEPLTSNDLDICQRALDEILARLKVGRTLRRRNEWRRSS